MKRTITLKVEYLDPAKLKRAEEIAQRVVLFEQAIESFHSQMGELNSSLKIIYQDMPREEIVIEFSDTIWDKLYVALIAAPVVAIIDAMIPKIT